MALTGNVDGLFEGVIHGWACRPDRPELRVEVVVRADGEDVVRTTADLQRDDLAGHGIGDGRYGFEIPAPPGLAKFRLSVQFAESGEPIPGSFADNLSVARRLELPRAENPLVEELIAEDGLSDRQAGLVRQFARDGFLKFRVTDPAFDELADAAIAGVDWSSSNGIRVQDAWPEVEAVRRLASLPEVMELLELLYGRPAVPFQTLSFRVGTQQETHSDSLHFSSRPGRFMCGVWIALEPVDERNGPLHYFPGSHRLPIYDLNDLGLLGDEASIEQNYEIYCDMLQAMIRAHGLHKQLALMDRGEGIVWAANLYHGGDPILDRTRTRYSQVTHYYFEGCAYYAPLSSDPFLNRYDRPDRRDVRTGRPIGHWFGTRPVGEADRADEPAILRAPPAARPLAARPLAARLRRFLGR
ncbi:phytanoyl-CoA dioxygenase family protein [Thalassobaculum sp.]|uniref:phytanoyl-CoA dioxygenase family protein n=1 Tax=Thalassobaculum sp. TaxID=2022740 RepID=UPI0032EABAA9